MSPQVHFLDLTLKSLPPAQFFIQIFPLSPTVALGLWCIGCGLCQQNKSVWTGKLSHHKARSHCTMIVQEWSICLSRAAGFQACLYGLCLFLLSRTCLSSTPGHGMRHNLISQAGSFRLKQIFISLTQPNPPRRVYRIFLLWTPGDSTARFGRDLIRVGTEIFYQAYKVR